MVQIHQRQKSLSIFVFVVLIFRIIEHLKV